MKKIATLKKSIAALALLGTTLTTPVFAHEGKVPEGVHRLDHVFVIVMENHHISQILGNPNATFITNYAASANLANNYYGVGHPSLTNYLEIVGGSNFGVVNDNSPDWHNTTCHTDLARNTLKTPQLEGSPNICPIEGSGKDAATPAVDSTNEGTAAVPVYNAPLDPAQTDGKTIADQLVAARLSWKSYQENLPPYGADGVNNSDGLVSDVTQAETGMPKLYAVKHNPFAYFANVQAGTSDDDISLKNIVGFDRLFADLAGYDAPNFALIAPNQCHDQHGRGTSEVGTGCSVDANTIGQGDAALKTLVDAIHASPSWAHGHNAIVVVWDENDYSSLPNQVLTIVETNYGPNQPIISNNKYNHFSLLKSIEAGFGLPCLNHACDANVQVMSDLFGTR